MLIFVRNVKSKKYVIQFREAAHVLGPPIHRHVGSSSLRSRLYVVTFFTNPKMMHAMLLQCSSLALTRAYNSVSNATAVGNEGAYTVDEKISKCDKRGGT